MAGAILLVAAYSSVMFTSGFSIISSFPAVGFSGSRLASSCPSSLPGQLAAALPVSVSVLVGCQQGVDAAVRAASYSPTVFSASTYGSGSWAYAARSAAMVRVLAAQGGVLVALPYGLCPSGVRVSRRFRGCGSGTWGSVALAIGLGVPVILRAPLPGAAVSAWQAWCGPLAGRFQLVGGVAGQCWLWTG